MRDATGVTYIHSDHLGGTSVTTDANGGNVKQQAYYPFGGVRPNGDTLGTDYGFTGQKLDASDGLMYYNVRYYSAFLGRFTQPDTIVPNLYNPQSLNRYSYVLNNPLRYSDPSGNCYTDISGNEYCELTKYGDPISIEGICEIVGCDDEHVGSLPKKTFTVDNMKKIIQKFGLDETTQFFAALAACGEQCGTCGGPAECAEVMKAVIITMKNRADCNASGTCKPTGNQPCMGTTCTFTQINNALGLPIGHPLGMIIAGCETGNCTNYDGLEHFIYDNKTGAMVWRFGDYSSSIKGAMSSAHDVFKGKYVDTLKVGGSTEIGAYTKCPVAQCKAEAPTYKGDTKTGKKTFFWIH